MFTLLIVLCIAYGCAIAFVTRSGAFIIGGAVVIGIGWVIYARLGRGAPRDRSARQLRRARQR